MSRPADSAPVAAVPTRARGGARIAAGDDRIGNFDFRRRGTIEHAVTAFGKPTSRRRNEAVCELRWPALGLKLVFSLQGGADPCVAEESRFGGAVLSGKQWETGKQLEVGSSQGDLQRLYPEAERYPGGWWALVMRGDASHPYPALGAKVDGERVVALYVTP